MKRVGIIGHFGFGQKLFNGQTIKTKIVTEGVEDFCKEESLKIDTHGGVRAIIPAIFGSLKALVECRNVIVMLTENGLKVCIPILVLFNMIFKRKLHYVVVGGWLPDFLKTQKVLSFFLKKMDFIYAETSNMKNSLEKQGFSNVIVMPNCKQLKIIDEPIEHEVPYKLCTFSRVMREKGIQDAVEAVVKINEKMGKVVYSLDIYGQVDANQVEWFDDLKQKFPSYIRYCGIIPFGDSSKVLKDYFYLLFPTYYYGEGFAGTAIDAFAAGVPVVASNWKYNEEVIHDGVNGFVFEAKNNDCLIEKLEYLQKHPEVRSALRGQCLKDAYLFQPEVVLQTLYKNFA